MNKKMSVKRMAVIGVLTALTCILAPLSVPIGPVPISLTNLVIYLGLYILGTRDETISYGIYLLIGFIGVPVFSQYKAGAAYLLGPTGGYLIGFIPMAVISGIFIYRFKDKWYMQLIGMIIGTAVCYIFGSAWLSYEAGYTFRQSLAAGVIPFIPGDLIKMVIAMLIGPQIDVRLKKAGIY